jgi:DNA transformation protein and related proteins
VVPEGIRELFAGFGTVTVKCMFGGAGIYAEETMFALLHEGVIYLKVDESSAPAFERESLAPFSYATKGRQTRGDVLSAHAGPPLRRPR